MTTKEPSKENRNPIYVVVENVRSLFNVGAIFRTADGVQASEIYLTGFTGCPPRKEIRRVALGAEESVPWTYVQDPLEAIDSLKQKGIQVVALESTENSTSFREFQYQLPTAMVIGHEVEGIRPETLAACDAVVQIPMRGEKISLNVSVACGIMLYELLHAVEKTPLSSQKFHVNSRHQSEQTETVEAYGGIR